MCRMFAASDAVAGSLVAGPFLRMARGENALHEKNPTPGSLSHGDGWGAVLDDRRGMRRVRSARSCWEDAAFAQVRASRARLLHARLASVAGLGEENAHPFSAEIRGETWHFCHNGTLRDEPDDGAGRTDSERFFRRMAVRLERQDPVAAFEGAAGALRDVTALNVLLVSAGALWAFCAWGDAAARSYYTLSWAATARGVIVSSEPLAELSPHWTPMENGTALVVAGSAPQIVRLRLPFLPTSGEA